jgi:hypothetical protein
MNEADYGTMKARIAKSGKNQAKFLRQAILEKKVVSTDGIKALVPELKRIGNNLNQIARRCNEYREADGDGQEQMEKLCGEIELIEKGLGDAWQLLKRLAAGQA